MPAVKVHVMFCYVLLNRRHFFLLHRKLLASCFFLFLQLYLLMIQKKNVNFGDQIDLLLYWYPVNIFQSLKIIYRHASPN